MYRQARENSFENEVKNLYNTAQNQFVVDSLSLNQGENIASMLINEAISYFRINNILNYQVFTKPIYENIFKNLGFKEIVRSDKVLMLEAGVYSINDEIRKIKKVLELNFHPLENADLGCVVLNANPITNGHVYLIEEALKKSKNLVVFVVEEDKLNHLKEVVREYTDNFKGIKGFMYSRPINDYEGSI